MSFINSDGKQQNLFSASRDEYYSIGKYSDLAARYNRENNQLLTNTLVPKVKNNLVFEGVKDGGNALSEAARAVLTSPTKTLRGVTGNLAHSLSECLKHPTACATEKWATFDSASGDLLRTHYNQADVNALYGKEMTAETALVPLVRGGTVVAEVLPAAKAGAVAVKSVDNMLSPLAKGVSANEKLPVVDKTVGYENQTTKISSGAENVVLYPKLKEQLQIENLNNIVKNNSILEHAALGKGNLTQKGHITREEVKKLAKEWVGDMAKETSNGWISADGTRLYRSPSVKKYSAYAETGIQANFQRGHMKDGKFITESNLHINIKD
ncbi:hypothetical protein ACWA5Z_11110 [Testudinibacter sp. P80/BLE/0925]|uniref:hypothetical protein n=1 Tax=Testudinibacter sp. TW-1 TaxID=3417757 RepID=UPI003D36A159